MKTLVMDVMDLADALDPADHAVLEVTRDMAAELLLLVARHRKELADQEKLCAVLYRDLYIPTFLGELPKGGYGDQLDSLLLEAARSGTWDSGVLVFSETIRIDPEAERCLEYPKLWVMQDRVFWRGSYRHEEVYAETAPLMRETLQQIAGVIKCP